MLIDNHNGKNIPVFYDKIMPAEEYYEFNRSEINGPKNIRAGVKWSGSDCFLPPSIPPLAFLIPQPVTAVLHRATPLRPCFTGTRERANDILAPGISIPTFDLFREF